MHAILNPQAGHGRAGAAVERIRRLLDDAGISLVCTEGPGHAIELARTLAEEGGMVAAIGGDGTMHEVANGIIESGKRTALGVVPFGTGNDFVKMTGTPRKLESAIKILIEGKRKAVDYGTLSYLSENAEGRRHFINTAGVGFDAEVGFRASSYKKLPGFTAYLAALVSTLQNINISKARVDVFGSSAHLSWFDGPMLLCTFGNGQYSGGLFRLTPAAAVDDGVLDVGVIERISVLRILTSIPRVLRGTHTNMNEFHATRVERVTIRLFPGLPVHSDGEILSGNAHQVGVHIVKSGLSIIVP